MGEDPLSLLLQSFMLYLAGPTCPASNQSLTKFWLTLPIYAIFMKYILHILHAL